MNKYIEADRLRAELEKRLKNVRDYMKGVWMKYKGPKYYKAQGKESAYDALLSIIDSLQQEQPEVDIVPLQEEKMVCYINYCLQREDDECICPNCGKYVTGLRLFPYYYDRENNDVYFASVCPECGKIIISKE